jgi:hypothetical protein
METVMDNTDTGDRMRELAERERQRSERLARLVIRHNRSHWLSFDEMMAGLSLRGME